MRSVQFYPLALEWWPKGGALRVMDQTGQTLITLPLDFLQSGHVSTIPYVLEQVFNTFEEGGVLSTTEGTKLTAESEVQAGKLVFLRSGEQCLDSTTAIKSTSEFTR